MENEKYKLQHWNAEEKKQYIIRLNKIQGQIRGIAKMLEENRDREDILIQLSSANQSIKGLGQKILTNKIKEKIESQKDQENYDFIDETMNALKKFI